mgnify:CR=1 FL=1
MEKTPEQIAAEEQAKVAAAEADAARAAEAEKLRAAEDARIRAEAERDAFKAAATARPADAAVWGDKEWSEFQEQTGMDKKQLAANAQLTNTLIEQRMAGVNAELKKAQDAARAAEERAAKLEDKTVEDKVRREYYQAKPAIARYDKDVEEFIGRFPAEQRKDPKAYKELLGMAETYVRGKVGATMKTGSASSGAFERGDEHAASNAEQELPNLEGLDSARRDMLMSLVPTKEQEDRLKAHDAAKYDKQGVYYKSEDEWATVHKDLAKRGSL